jgi:hypothetical protein
MRKITALLLSVLLTASAVAQPAPFELIPVEGTCEAFNLSREVSGVTDENGLPHPGYAGWTTATVSYRYTTRYTVARARGQVRLDATVNVKFIGKAAPARLDWRPPYALPRACRADKERWERQVEAHETRHVRDFEQIMKSALNPWKNGWKLTVTGATEEQAQAELDRRVRTAFRAEAQRILDRNNAVAEAFHRSSEGRPIGDMDCDLCREPSR